MSIGPEAGRRRGRVTGWVGALRQRRPWAAERSDGKPEQASKVLMRMPTLRSFGEGCTRGEVIDKRTHAIRRGSGYGTSVGWFVVTGGDGNSLKVEFHLCVSNIAHSDKRSGTPYLTKFGENTSKRHQTVAARNIEVLRRAVPMPPDGTGRARPLTLGNKKIDYGRNLHRLTLLTHLSNSGGTTTRSRTMKNILLATVAILAFAAPSFAQDKAGQAPPSTTGQAPPSGASSFYVVQVTTTMKCAVINRQPADDKMKVIGAAHSSQAEAQTALIAYKTCAQ